MFYLRHGEVVVHKDHLVGRSGCACGGVNPHCLNHYMIWKVDDVARFMADNTDSRAFGRFFWRETVDIIAKERNISRFKASWLLFKWFMGAYLVFLTGRKKKKTTDNTITVAQVLSAPIDFDDEER